MHIHSYAEFLAVCHSASGLISKENLVRQKHMYEIPEYTTICRWTSECHGNTASEFTLSEIGMKLSKSFISAQINN